MSNPTLPPTEVSESSPTTEPAKKSAGGSVVKLLIVVVCLAAAGYITYSNMREEPAPFVPPAATPRQPTPSAITDAPSAPQERETTAQETAPATAE